ncbi:MAG: double-strand break repair helicase AddA [Rhodospirillales bacterium]|nr:double-strand break repair helicase AddA [Rhodospirillales bacterium]
MTGDALHQDQSGLGAQVTAADPAHSVWVSANAGTGKTRVLIKRIMRLLLNGTPPGKILCLTFTKAAAAEMENRLSAQLGHWSAMTDEDLTGALRNLLGVDVDPALLSLARRLFAEILEAPGGLQIRTIHSFCESLLGRFPLEAGVPPHFSVVDERTAAELMTEARDRAFVRASSGQAPDMAAALETLAELVDESRFAGLMRELSFNRSRLQALLDTQGSAKGLIDAIAEALGVKPGDTPKSIIDAATREGAFDATALRQAAEALQDGTAKDQERADVITVWLDHPAQRPGLFQGAYGGLFLKKDGGAKADSSMITKAPREAHPGALDALLAEQARLLAVTDSLKAVATAVSTAALVTIGSELLGTFEEMKATRALLDYDDLILKTRDLMQADGQAAWVHYKLDGGIDHILVDEAQDTSPEQWDIIQALAGEFFAGLGAREADRTVFAVGDEKQSIYSFQGADPRQFGAMLEHFAGEAESAEKPLRSVEMAPSFRSSQSILDAVDTVFAAPGASDGLTFADRPIRHPTMRRGQAGRVEIWPTITPEDAPDTDPWEAPLDRMPAFNPPAQLADRIAGRIEGWLRDGEILESAGRAMRPGDIMILVRTRNRFTEEMIRCLKVRGIPVAGADRMVLTEQLAVMDLMALSRFLLLPEDDLTLAVVLKSPLIGFDDDQLFDLAYGREGSLWSALKARRGGTDAFEAAAAWLGGLLAETDFTPPFEFFSGVLGPGGGRHKLLARLGPDAADPIDEFLNLALAYEHEHAPSLQGFLHWLEAGETQIKRDLEHGRGEVRVMTVHGAKGLQANVVFLPDTCTKPDGRTDSQVLWVGDEALFWPSHRASETDQCTGLREALAATRDQEYRRLLYVAMTRAQDRLYVAGWETLRGRSDGCWYDMIDDALADTSDEISLKWGDQGLRFSNPQTADPDNTGRLNDRTTDREPLPTWALSPPAAEEDPPRPLTPSRPDGAEPAVRSPFDGDDGARFKRGLLVHRLLQSLPDLAPIEREAAARAFLARPTHGLDDNAQAEIASEALGVLGHPDHAAFFGPGSQAEVPLAGVVNGFVISAQVDRLLVTEDAVSIIDFKTNRPPPRSADKVAEIYLRQMAAYRAAVAQIYTDRPVRCLLLWTDGPDLMELPDSLLDQYEP